MADPTITEYMKYADLQMAAEALYGFDAKLNASKLVPSEPYSGTIPIEVLTTGNLHASKFTRTQAEAFVKEWTVVDHISNTTTGFSGTLFMNKDDGKYYMSLRSTEFIDDAVRDSQATNLMEVSEYGFAFGQIADLENWYQRLITSGKLPADKQLSVTGYSLGGHLATAFNLMYPHTFERVVTFNGAGVGKIKGSYPFPLGGLITRFDTLRKNEDGLAITFRNEALSDLYAQLRSRIKGGALPTSADYAALDELETMGAITVDDIQTSKDIAHLRKAMKRIEQIDEEIQRLRSVADSKDGAPAQIPAGQIEQMNLDYQMAVVTVAEHTESRSKVLDGFNIVLGRSQGTPGLHNQYDVVGTETTSTPWGMIANSQWHHGHDVPVFIEDQPLYRGDILEETAKASHSIKDPKLLVSEYSKNDFGDTHSLVLIADSLRVQELLGKLDSKLNPQNLSGIFTLGSGRRKTEKTGTQGQAEGDALDNILNALGEQLLGEDKFTRLKGDPSGNTWARIRDGKDTDTTYSDRGDVAELSRRGTGCRGEWKRAA